MVWPLLAIAGTAALSGFMQQKAAGEQALRTNKELIRVNKANLQRNLITQGIMAQQRAQQLLQIRDAEAGLNRASLTASSDAGVTAAASGTVGASVDAVQSDIDMKFSEAKLRLEEEAELQTVNYNNELYALLQNAQSGQHTLVDVGAARGSKYAPLLQGGMAAFSAYASARMDLGLGKGGAQTST